MSIYAETGSVDGADAAVSAVGTVGGPPDLLDQELVIPDYDDDDDNDDKNTILTAAAARTTILATKR